MAHVECYQSVDRDHFLSSMPLSMDFAFARHAGMKAHFLLLEES